MGANLPPATTFWASSLVLTWGTTMPWAPRSRGTIDQVLVISVDANYRGDADEVASAGEVAQLGRSDGAVLPLQPHAVESVWSQRFDVVGIGKPPEHGDDLALSQLVLDSVWSDFHKLISWLEPGLRSAIFATRRGISTARKTQASCPLPAPTPNLVKLEMRKIMVIGSGGAGKSTVATEIGRLLSLPVFHLDAFFWNPGWTETPREE